MYIKDLFIYPVKSCAGIAIQEMPLVATGPRYDRMFVVVNAEGDALTQIEHPRLCLVQPSFTRRHIAIRIPGVGTYYTPLEMDAEDDSKVVVLGDACQGMDEGEKAAAMFSEFLGEPCRLIRESSAHPRIRITENLPEPITLSFAHTRPFHVLAQASLDDLNRHLDEPVLMNRFRPNIVIGDAEPHAENAWAHLVTKRTVFYDAGPCVRCATVSVDQETGMVSHEPLRTLRNLYGTKRGIVFGRLFRHINLGALRVGGPITKI